MSSSSLSNSFCSKDVTVEGETADMAVEAASVAKTYSKSNIIEQYFGLFVLAVVIHWYDVNDLSIRVRNE